jgi:hypothetical protein
MPKKEIASYLARTLNEVVYFLIVKRYVIAKEEGLNILLLSNTQNKIASYLAMTLIQVDSFLIEKRYVIAKEVRLKQSLVIEYPKGDCFVPRNDDNRG